MVLGYVVWQVHGEPVHGTIKPSDGSVVVHRKGCPELEGVKVGRMWCVYVCARVVCV